MIIFLRRVVMRLLVITLVGWVIRMLIASSNPRAQRIGRGANRVVGGLFGLDEHGRRVRGGRAARLMGAGRRPLR